MAKKILVKDAKTILQSLLDELDEIDTNTFTTMSKPNTIMTTPTKSKPMTVAELYAFAEKHGFEHAQLCFQSGTNVRTIFEDARLEFRAREQNDDEETKRIYLIG